MKAVSRAVLAIAGLVLAAASFVHAAAEAGVAAFQGELLSKSGLTAESLATTVENGFALEMSASQPQSPSDVPRFSDELVSAARQSYAVDPLAVASLRAISLGSVMHDDPQRARQILRLSERISKRDAIVNLWLAQDYGQLGDVEATLRSFDHALRTSTRARQLAMTPLVQSLAARESHAPLGGLLRRHPEWEAAFWREFVRNPVALASAGDFFEGSAVPLNTVPLNDRMTLYANLKAVGLFDTLAQLAALDPSADTLADDLASGKFVSVAEGNPLAWTTHSRGTYAASIGPEAGTLDIDARGGAFGLAAERIMRAGNRLGIAINMAEAIPEGASVEVEIVCADRTAGPQPGTASAERTLGSISLGSGDRTGEAVVDAAACRFARVALSFAVDPGRRDVRLSVANILVRPA